MSGELAVPALYRAAWRARQDDGTEVTFRSHEYRSVIEALDDADSAARLTYVSEAWVERAEWVRIPKAGKVAS